MASALLETKFHLPKRRRGSLVVRSRLSDRLSHGTESTLTLVSAPAGFGKTTMLAECLAAPAAEAGSLAWLSLDQRDNDPALYWTYVIAALRTAAPGVGAVALSLLGVPQPPVEAVLASLLNDLGALDNDVVLVLDDYHVIDARAVHDGMAFVLEHLPARIHLVIASRSDPALPLARLRGRGELVEIRATDLRFTPDEAAAYLNDVMGLALTAQDITALERRTEGWIAALQLAGLSMQGREDVAGFIAGFSGDDRYIVDYLAEEVLQRQTDSVRDFLLATSILERLSGPLCDAVTGQEGGNEQLAALDRANLFLVPLDDRRRWYRYHQLFADVLRARLHDERLGDVAELHRRASAWYDQHDEPADAIRHALAANDFERAADLAELAVPVMLRTRREATLRDWVKALPDEVVRVRPVLSAGLAAALLAGGELDDVDDRLRVAEEWLDQAAGRCTGPQVSFAEMVVVDDEEFRRLPAATETHRAGLALAMGDEFGAVNHARRALEIAADDDYLSRAGAAALLGLTFWAAGDLEAAHQAYNECLAGLLRAGNVADTLGCAIVLADIRLVQGRLGEARRTYEQGLRRALQPDGSVLRGTADMYVGLSAIHREQNDLGAARDLLLRSQELGEHAALPQNPYRWRVAMARIQEAEGNVSAADELFDEAERLYVGDFSPNVHPIAASRARLWVTQGRLAEALDWTRLRGLSADDELSYLREFEHITLARVLLARHETEQAFELLERLLRPAEAGGRIGSIIEILLLQALAEKHRSASDDALVPLARALDLAELEGYVRLFVDEGSPMATLLAAAGERRIAPGYVRRLLAAFEEPDNGGGGRELVDPLSQRELEVLRLLATELSGPEIAREFVVSLNTVRTHTKNIYAKLGVNNRRAAIRQARQLGLLTRT